MSQSNSEFVPPPPPGGSSIYPPDVLARQTQLVASEVKTALVLSIIGLFCFGFLFGFLAFRKANEALDVIRVYDVAHDKKGLAMTAKVLSVIDIVAWTIGLVLRFTLLN